jgi:predicted dehydrogenase
MPSPTEPVRLVQVGAGLMGRAWLRAIGPSTDVRLVGLADLDLDTARRSAADAGFTDVAVATTLEELLDRVEADAVINVTIPEAHAEVSTIALLSGLAVLCEKPLADTLPSALSMIAAAEAGGRLLMVSQSRRYLRNVEGLRGQIARLGRLGIVACSVFKSPHFGGFREQMADPLLKDMAIHQFDLARDLIGSEPVSISCESFNPGWSWYAGDAAAEVNTEFADGTRFVLTGSWCSPGLESRGTAAGGSAEPMARRSGTATTHRQRRQLTAQLSPPWSAPVPRKSPVPWPSSSPRCATVACRTGRCTET